MSSKLSHNEPNLRKDRNFCAEIWVYISAPLCVISALVMRHREIRPVSTPTLRQRETVCRTYPTVARLILDIHSFPDVKPTIPGRFGPRHFAAFPEVFSGGVNGSGVRLWFPLSLSATHRQNAIRPRVVRLRSALIRPQGWFTKQFCSFDFQDGHELQKAPHVQSHRVRLGF